MYNNCFDEYYNISIDELKVKICHTLETLTLYCPEEFSRDLLENITTQQDSTTFIQNLVNLVPIIKPIEKNFALVTEIEAVRMSAITLDSYYYANSLERISIKLLGLAFAEKFMAFRYIVAVEIIEKKLKEDLKYNSQLLYEELLNPKNPEDRSVYESLLAQEEIARVSENENVKDFFWKTVWNFEDAIEDYVKQNLHSMVYEMFNRIFYEAVISNSSLLDEPLGSDEPFSAKDKRKFIKLLFNMSHLGTNFRMGVKHGGVREREGFSWNQRSEIKFYKRVESIPKINRKKNGVRESIYVWDYIYEQFNSRGMEAKNLVKAEPACRSISPELLDEAFEKWQKCEDSHRNLGKEDSPKMFLFRYVLQLLGYPDGYFNKSRNQFIPYKKLTLQKHYDAGEKVVMDSDKQDKTCLSEVEN